jgi:hypothetical protein
MYVGLVGNPSDGFTVWGPFEDFEDMTKELEGNEWWGVTLNTHVKHKWENPLIQFARLITEMESVGFFDDLSFGVSEKLSALKESMDIDGPVLDELIDRAQSFWDEYLRVERQLTDES